MLIWVIQVLRAVVGQSFLTFMPLLFVGQGYSLTTAGALFSLFTVAGTFSGVLAGHLSDRFGFKPVFYGVYGLMTPLLIFIGIVPAVAQLGRIVMSSPGPTV